LALLQLNPQRSPAGIAAATGLALQQVQHARQTIARYQYLTGRHIIHAPRSGSHQSLVLAMLKRDVTTVYDIAAATGLAHKQVSRALRKIEQRQFWHRTDEARYAARRASMMRTKGSIMADVQPFAQLGMGAAEIRIALRLLQGNDYPLRRIRAALQYGRRRGFMRMVTTDELYDLRRSLVNQSAAALEARVSLWVNAVRAVARSAGEPWPATRVAWLATMARLQARGVISTDRSAWHRLANVFRTSIKDRPLQGDEALELLARELRLADALRTRGGTTEEITTLFGAVNAAIQRRPPALSSARANEWQFAAALLHGGWIGSDLFYFRQLQLRYARHRRPLPTDFAERLRAEALLRAVLNGDATNAFGIQNYLTAPAGTRHGMPSQWSNGAALLSRKGD
jgi:hypothetical protein